MKRAMALCGHYVHHLIIAFELVLLAVYVQEIARRAFLDEQITQAGAVYPGATWWVWLGALGFGLLMVYGLFLHEQHLCTRCANVPRHGPRLAERWHNILWLHHFWQPSIDKPLWHRTRLTMAMFVLIVASWFVAPWPTLALGLLLLSWSVSIVKHRRLAAWCLTCQQPPPPPSTRMAFKVYKKVVLGSFGGPPGCPVTLVCNEPGCDGDTREDFPAGTVAALDWLAGHIDTDHADRPAQRPYLIAALHIDHD